MPYRLLWLVFIYLGAVGSLHLVWDIAAPPNGLGITADTSSGLYTLSIDAANASGYTATATAVAGKSQSHDANCTVMRVRLDRANVQYGGCAGCAADGVLSDPDRCWSR